ncbi:MAG: hypothetical protein V3571_12035 [Pseudodesulfovibrio sp.]
MATLIVALLLALHVAPAVGYGTVAGQPLNRGIDAARFATAILGAAVGVADLVERPQCPDAQATQPALLPGAARFKGARPALRSARDVGPGPAATALAGTIPIRAPPGLPSSTDTPV